MDRDDGVWARTMDDNTTCRVVHSHSCAATLDPIGGVTTQATDAKKGTVKQKHSNPQPKTHLSHKIFWAQKGKKI